MNKGILKYFLFIVIILIISPEMISGQREVISFNDEWIFIKGNPPKASMIQTNESGWEKVKLPHDWAEIPNHDFI
jgi:beta-galactosidase